MGNLDFSANADQLKELATYMASQINVPTIGIGGGYAPIGTIISVMGTTAPQDYLACDGTVYNIADYPQLANYFESQFGESNHFGGDGATTFAVPDLQGEFLRGTGTNSHANQGSGANVGTHQDGTYVPKIVTKSSGGVFYKQANDWEGTKNLDNITFGTQYGGTNVTWTNMASQDVGGTTRPTNTSVLYCIKAVVAGDVYSTEERVVGTWIDGKKIYRKTVIMNNPVNDARNQIGINFLNDVQLVKCEYIGITSTGKAIHTYYQNQADYFMCGIGGDDTSIYCSWKNPSITKIYATFYYTKTTD